MTFNYIDITLLVPLVCCDICQRTVFHAAGFGPAGNQMLKDFPITVEITGEAPGFMNKQSYTVKDAPSEEDLKRRAVAAGWLRLGQSDIERPEVTLIGYMVCPACIPHLKNMATLLGIATPDLDA